MLRYVLAAVAVVVPCNALADTYLCIPEAGATVISESGIITAGAAKVDTVKFIQSQDSGKWSVKMLGDNHAMFDECISKYHCESSRGWGGVFMRNNDDALFSVVWMTLDGNKRHLVSAKGKCSKL